MPEGHKRIKLCVSNKKAYVWNTDDVAALRAQHHICGVLTGTLPHLSQQNIFLGLPLALTPEEVVLLVQEQLAVIVDDPNAHRQASSLDLETWNSERITGVKAQIIASEVKDVKDQNTTRFMSEEAVRKRREREEKRAAAARAKAIAEGLDLDAVTKQTSVAPIPESVKTVTPPSLGMMPPNANYTVTVPASSTELEWYNHEGAAYETIEAAKNAGIWAYPGTSLERARCGVFRDLWKQGYYMGGGIKFGGDFLVYPGDPLRYHSHNVASVIESPSSAIYPMEIVAHGRLGTATKKSHLLCSWDDEKQKGTYYSIEWAGFG